MRAKRSDTAFGSMRETMLYGPMLPVRARTDAQKCVFREALDGAGIHTRSPFLFSVHGISRVSKSRKNSARHQENDSSPKRSYHNQNSRDLALSTVSQ